MVHTVEAQLSINGAGLLAEGALSIVIPASVQCKLQRQRRATARPVARDCRRRKPASLPPSRSRQPTAMATVATQVPTAVVHQHYDDDLSRDAWELPAKRQQAGVRDMCWELPPC